MANKRAFIDYPSVNPLTNKFNYVPGGSYNGVNSGNDLNRINAMNGVGSNYGGGAYGPYGTSPYGVRNPNGQVNGPFQGIHGMFPPDFEGKSSLILPLAGAALLGNEIFLAFFQWVSYDLFLCRHRSLHLGV